MTEPAAPAPGVPAQEPPTQPPAGPTQSQPAAQPPAPHNEPVDVASLPANVQKMISDLRSEAAKNRDKSGQAGAAEEARREIAEKVARALGIAGDEPPDPEVLLTQVQDARDEAWRTSVEFSVWRFAAEAGLDPDVLLDSNRFIDTLDDLVDLDPRSEEFRTAMQAKVQEAVASGKYGKAQQTRFAGPADGGARSATTVSQLTEADLRRMSPEQIVAARAAGQLQTLLAG